MKLNLGSGTNYLEGYVNVDNNPAYERIDEFYPMEKYVQKIDKDSCTEIICRHSIEFLDGHELYDFMNELHRIMKKNGQLVIEITSVTMPGGSINPRAWTVPLLKTHFSPDTFKCFLGGPTLYYRGVKKWNKVRTKHFPSGAYKIVLTPVK